MFKSNPEDAILVEGDALRKAFPKGVKAHDARVRDREIKVTDAPSIRRVIGTKLG